MMTSRRNIFQSFTTVDDAARELDRVPSLRRSVPLAAASSSITLAAANATAPRVEQDDEAVQALRLRIKQEAKQQEVLKRRAKRKRRAHGSACKYYCTTRLQLSALITKPRNLLVFLLGCLAVLGVWIFLVYGQPRASSASRAYWSTITANESTSTWGGLLASPQDVLCEQVSVMQFVKQPSNALSTVSYALVAWFLAYTWALDVHRASSSFEARFGNQPASLVLRRCAWTALLAVSLVFLAIGAFLRHATMSHTGKRLETSGYWTVLFALTTCSLARAVDVPRKLRSETRQILSATLTFVLVFATLGIDVWFGIRLELLKAPMIPEIVFGSLAGLSLLCWVVGSLANWRAAESEVYWILFGLLSFVAGFLLARYDVSEVNETCALAGSFYQSYAMWHVLCALSVLCFYLYLRSELWRTGDGAEFAPRIRPLYKLRKLTRYLVAYFRDLVADEGGDGGGGGERTRQRRRQQGEFEEEKQDVSDGDDADGPTTTTSNMRRARTNNSPYSSGFNMVQLKFAQGACGLVISGAVIYVVYVALSDPQ